MRIVILGLTITSSWGNGHATTYRGLVRGLARRGHDVLFLERDRPWYAGHRDLPRPAGGRTVLYSEISNLRSGDLRSEIEGADAVIVGSYVPDGVAVGELVTTAARGVTAFYDIDTPVTLAKLARGDHEYLSPGLIPRYDLYLSFTGGPTLRRLEREFRSPRARPLYCSVDPEVYRPAGGGATPDVDLGYLGTYSDDRQPVLDRLLVEPARRLPERRFVVAGPKYPDAIDWPANVRRVEHLPPGEHAKFYTGQRYTLNVTRADMVAAGWSPSVRLFEAAACGVPIVSDRWAGLGEFFADGSDILTADSAGDVAAILTDLPDERRRAVGEAGRRRVLAAHTADHRAAELETYLRGE